MWREREQKVLQFWNDPVENVGTCRDQDADVHESRFQNRRTKGVKLDSGFCVAWVWKVSTEKRDGL